MAGFATGIFLGNSRIDSRFDTYAVYKRSMLPNVVINDYHLSITFEEDRK